MGFYIDLTDSSWEIPESAEVLSALKEMPTKYHAIKRGGGGGESWFSWMQDDEILNAESAQQIFIRLGFDTEKTETGFTLNGYNDKLGQEDIFLAVVAPFVKEGSYIEFHGEDNSEWQYSVHGGKLHYSEASKSFSEPYPYIYTHYQTVNDNFQAISIDLYGEMPAGVFNGYEKITV